MNASAISSFFDASRITARMAGLTASATGSAVAVEVIASTGSTNSDLLQRCSDLEQPTALIAVEQTAGRGRAGRSWLAPAGQSLTLSLAWPCFAAAPARLSGLSLAVGLSVAETLNQWLADRGSPGNGADVIPPIRLKWPNDILLDDAKLAGILIETRQVGPCLWVVIGVGLNVHDITPSAPLLQTAQALSGITGRAVASLGLPAAEQPAASREAVLAALLSGMASLLPQFLKSGLAPFRQRWEKLHAWQGRTVSLRNNGSSQDNGSQPDCEGIALGIDPHGALLIRQPDGTIATCQAGDMSLQARPE